MKRRIYIVTSALAVVVTFSIIIGTLIYAYQYTLTHTDKNNTFSNQNGSHTQDEFQKRNDNNPQISPPNGDFNKPYN
jgi:hypothetical protein